jgi:hypothetical protein
MISAKPRLLPNKRRLPKGDKSVTMVVGFLCRDGVVIGADTQVTGANYTFPECKLKNFEWANGSGILGYSGNRDMFLSFAKELDVRASEDTNLTEQGIRDVFRDCLEAVKEKKEVLLIMAGCWVDGARFPFLVSSTTTRRIVDVTNSEVIGYADSPLARYLLGRFRGLCHSVSVQQARIYAVDFISQAKKYDGQYVGGDIVLYSIEDHDPGRLWPSVPSGSGITREGKHTRMIMVRSDTWDREISIMNDAFDEFFCALINPVQQPSLNSLSGQIKMFRSWATGKPLGSG